MTSVGRTEGLLLTLVLLALIAFAVWRADVAHQRQLEPTYHQRVVACEQAGGDEIACIQDPKGATP